MSIRKKLIISNILIIVIPLGIALSLFAVFFNGPGGDYWETMEDIYKDNNGLYTVRSELNTYCWRHDLSDTKGVMKDAGYHFSIAKNGKEMYSNITNADMKQAEKAVNSASGDLFSTKKQYMVTEGKVTVVFFSKGDHDNTYECFAVHTPNIPVKTGESYIKRYITFYVGFMIAIVVIAVVIINILLSWWIARNILKPLKKLSVGSDMIKKGYLDFELEYNKKDEMGEVISDFNDMRRYLKNSVDERLRYEQYRKELIIGISHDLRTPLASIKGYMEGLRDGIASTAEKKAEYYEAIEISIKNIEHLVDNLTNFSRLQMGRENMKMEKTELNGYYSEAVKDLNTEYEKDNLQISFQGEAEELYAMIDKKEMGRVTHNIINNTLKYGKLDNCANVVISLEKKDFGVRIKIKDDGPGIDEKDMGRIFECFYRSDSSRTAPGEGNGIGSAVVKQIINSMSGSVHAENDSGLAMIIDLPLCKGGEENE